MAVKWASTMLVYERAGTKAASLHIKAACLWPLGVSSMFFTPLSGKGSGVVVIGEHACWGKGHY